MKPILLLTALALFSPFGQLCAKQLSGVASPCQPSAAVAPVAGTYGCFSFSVTNPSTITSSFYSWDFGDGSSGTGQTLFHCYPPSTVTTVYTITVTYNSPVLCGPVSNQQSFTLALNPPPQGECVQAAPCFTLSALTVTLCGEVFIPEIMHSYSYGDGTFPTFTNTHQYAQCGNYIIEKKQWGTTLMPDTCYSWVAVNIACTGTTVTGVKEISGIEKNALTAYPNPAASQLTIDAGTNIVRIQVTDYSGRNLFLRDGINTAHVELCLNEFAAGAYVVTVHDANGLERHCKFMKE